LARNAHLPVAMREARLVRVLAFALTSLVASSAAAEEQAKPETARGYTNHVVMCDALSAAPLVGHAALIVGSLARPALFRSMIDALPYTAAVSGVGYLSCSPIVHLAHRRPGSALASFGVRAALPLVAGLLTYGIARATTEPGDHFANGWQAAAFGGVAVPASFGVALAFDYTVLAR
jgi:hypothetical protein